MSKQFKVLFCIFMSLILLTKSPEFITCEGLIVHMHIALCICILSWYLPYGVSSWCNG